MQNVLANWKYITKQGIYPVPYTAETRLSMVDLKDVAEVAAIILTESGHSGATYELSGSEKLSQKAIAEILENHLKRTVRVEVISAESWEVQARTSNLDDYRIESLLKMFRYYESYGFSGNPGVLGWLLGREPRTFSEFVIRSVQDRE